MRNFYNRGEIAMSLQVKFWGVRGSVPSPLTSQDVEDKLKDVSMEFAEFVLKLSGPILGLNKFLEDYIPLVPFWLRGTYGGNTSCVEVRAGDTRIVLDMGTGLRALGQSLLDEMFQNKGLKVTFLLSHVHWDHIQGLPFFAPIYTNKETGICNSWTFYGGTDWQKNAEICLRGQMDPPVFPVSWREIQKITAHISLEDVYDMKTFKVGDVSVRTRKLNHPQETYGWRLEYEGRVITYTTDNEPYGDPLYPDPRLLELARDADLWITDCQYTMDQYNGSRGGVARHGWGHSYPEAVAHTAIAGGVKRIILFHHDPASSDKHIHEMEEHTRKIVASFGGKSYVTAAHEGLEINV